MKKIFSIILFILISIISGCQQKSDSNSASLRTLDSSISLYEDDLIETINLSNLTIIKSSSENLVYTILTLPEHGNVYKTNIRCRRSNLFSRF